MAQHVSFACILDTLVTCKMRALLVMWHVLTSIWLACALFCGGVTSFQRTCLLCIFVLKLLCCSTKTKTTAAQICRKMCGGKRVHQRRAAVVRRSWLQRPLVVSRNQTSIVIRGWTWRPSLFCKDSILEILVDEAIQPLKESMLCLAVSGLASCQRSLLFVLLDTSNRFFRSLLLSWRIFALFVSVAGLDALHPTKIQGPKKEIWFIHPISGRASIIAVTQQQTLHEILSQHLPYKLVQKCQILCNGKLLSGDASVKELPGQPVVRPCINAIRGGGKQILLQMPGASFFHKVLLPADCATQLFRAGLVEEMQALSDIPHFAWCSHVPSEEQWTRLFAVMPPSQQKIALQKKYAKDLAASQKPPQEQHHPNPPSAGMPEFGSVATVEDLNTKDSFHRGSLLLRDWLRKLTAAIGIKDSQRRLVARMAKHIDISQKQNGKKKSTVALAQEI